MPGPSPTSTRSDVVPDLKAKTLFWTIDARYPIVRRQSSNLWARGRVRLRRPEGRFLRAADPDKLRVLWLRADWDAIDLTSRRPGWRANAFAEVRRGLGIFDASDGCDGLCPLGEIGRPAGSTANRPRRCCAPAARASWRWAAISPSRSTPRLQYALDALLSFEEFTAGNYTVGRGYDPATLSGDSGVGLTAELRGPRWMPIEQSKLTLQPYVFGDAAWVWNKHDGDRRRASEIGRRRGPRRADRPLPPRRGDRRAAGKDRIRQSQGRRPPAGHADQPDPSRRRS